jgi:hypothetical protein
MHGEPRAYLAVWPRTLSGIHNDFPSWPAKQNFQAIQNVSSQDAIPPDKVRLQTPRVVRGK